MRSRYAWSRSVDLYSTTVLYKEKTFARAIYNSTASHLIFDFTGPWPVKRFLSQDQKYSMWKGLQRTTRILQTNQCTQIKANKSMQRAHNLIATVDFWPFGLGYFRAWYRRFSGERRRCDCLLYTSPSPRDRTRSRMPSSA